MDKITLILCLIELNRDSKSRLQLFIDPNILREQMDVVQSCRQNNNPQIF